LLVLCAYAFVSRSAGAFIFPGLQHKPLTTR